MTRRVENLLGQPGGAPENPQGHHPDGSWRADSLGTSRHARLTEHIREPLDDPDPERAREVCAEVCRGLLGDFAPALMRVAPEPRARCQALACWLRTLFDFATQPGIEGERLAALNRLEFTLEQALSGDPVGQPVFLAMAIAEERQPWSEEALDVFLVAARRRIVEPRLTSAAEVDADSMSLAGAICLALTDTEVDTAVARLVAACLRLGGLLDLGEAIRRGREPLPTAELPSRGEPGEVVDRPRLDRAVRMEIERLRPILQAGDAVRLVPADFQPAVRYIRLAAARLADRADALGGAVVDAAPQLGVGSRLWLLTRSRFI